MKNEAQVQFAVYRVHTVQKKKYLVWNSYNRYFETVQKVKQAIEEEKEALRYRKMVEVNGVLVSVEDSWNTKFKWIIQKRIIPAWEVIEEIN